MFASEKFIIVLFGIILIIGAAICISTFIIMSKPKETLKRSYDLELKANKISNMKIKSSSFENNQMIPSRYTCDGENINPDILIEQVPKESKSLVLIVDDPDAPMGTWVHWTLWNIRPDIKEIAAGHVPEGSVQGMTSFGKPGYGGPCPPFGTHRYFFKIYAIDTILELGSNAGKAELEKAISGHILDKAQIVGLYKRK